MARQVGIDINEVIDVESCSDAIDHVADLAVHEDNHDVVALDPNLTGEGRNKNMK